MKLRNGKEIETVAEGNVKPATPEVSVLLSRVFCQLTTEQKVPRTSHFLQRPPEIKNLIDLYVPQDHQDDFHGDEQ